jgi:hypothetical protein
MKNCSYIKTLLPLFDSDELAAIEKRQINDHVATCQNCREELAAIRALHADLQRAGAFEPSQAMLADLRHDLRRRLRHESLRPSWQEKLGSLLFGNFRPVVQLGFTVAMLLIGLFIGREFFAPTSRQGKIDVLSYLTPGKPLAIPSGYLAPSFAQVQAIRIDPATKQIEIQYSMMNDVQLRGSIDNPQILQALSYALREEDQPSLRLRAIKAISETYVSTGGALPDNEITEALLHAIENDPNAGVRLKAAQVLKQLPLSGVIKNTLIRVLMRDENSAVRIEAIEALGQGGLSQDEQAVFHTAASDTNEYVRLQAKRLLSGELEKPRSDPNQNKL